MKVIPSEFEPRQQAPIRKGPASSVASKARKVRLSLIPVVADNRLFHAL